MSFDGVRWTWLNGDFVPWPESLVPLSTHALHYGTGVFEGIRSYAVDGEPVIFRLDAHLERLYRSAAAYGMDIPYSHRQMSDVICELIRRNGLLDSYIRPIVYLGGETLGIRAKCATDTAVLAWPQMAHVSEQSRRRGARVTVSPYRKIHHSMLPTTAKACGQYLNSRLATMDAARRGFDEALLLNMEGNIAEAAVANIFVVKNETLYTNDEKSSILMGITRDSVIQLARAQGWKVEVGALTVNQLQHADEAFLCGTACEILPVAEVDGTKIGNGVPGVVTERIRTAYDRAKSGMASEWRHWLHPVNTTKKELVAPAATGV